MNGFKYCRAEHHRAHRRPGTHWTLLCQACGLVRLCCAALPPCRNETACLAVALLDVVEAQLSSPPIRRHLRVRCRNRCHSLGSTKSAGGQSQDSERQAFGRPRDGACRRRGHGCGGGQRCAHCARSPRRSGGGAAGAPARHPRRPGSLAPSLRCAGPLLPWPPPCRHVRTHSPETMLLQLL